jgi:precorrin-4/cobalt-precorrin-4 C11-methyltransferase
LLPDEAEKHDSASLTLNEICKLFRDAYNRDLDVLRLHTGDPTIYGAIAEQMDELDRMYIDYEVVPGISSFQAAASDLRIELTVPEVSQTIILSRMAGQTPVPETQSLEQLGATRSTLCLFLSVQRITEVVSALIPFYGTSCPAAVAHRIGWPDQKIVQGNLGDIAEKLVGTGINRTAVILVGHALARGGPVSKLYDVGFAHGYRKGRT